ncbi:MAG: alpha-galactosidase, partial [Microlunatus sp.]|nr:alpha-galactosidase [Microlunatus sp.]
MIRPPELRAGDHTTVSVERSTDRAGSYAITSTGSGSGDAMVLGSVILQEVGSIAGFTSSWGQEFQPVQLPLSEPAALEVTSGRSSNGANPWLELTTADGVVVVTLHWSGNWRISTTPDDAGTVEVSIELPAAGQQPRTGEALPTISLAWGPDRRLASAALAAHLRGQVPAGPPLLTEWNHWWPYEDTKINEDVFLANAEIAAKIGFDVAVLDAGWFGRADADSAWYSVRGDWHLVNTARFPHGLGWLADETRRRGIELGIWIEGEAVGADAAVAEKRPELLALGADGNRLGYICFGSPAGREHIIRTVTELIDGTSARWIKWDFNLDPGTGCVRTDHGHRADDGLLQHYRGLYQVLDEIRAARPETIIEACSSGGLRIDAGLAQHVDAFFLSDPDWTEHHLTCLWGAAQLLPARQLLHWPQSEWRGEHRFQKVDYSGSLITRSQFDTKIRAALLHRLGLSVRLTELRPDLRQRLSEHVAGYRNHIRPLVESGVIMTLTDQPLREEQGCRQPAFQLTSGDDHLIAGFRLPPTGDWQPVLPVGLDPAQPYAVRSLDGSELIDLGDQSGAKLVDAG